MTLAGALRRGREKLAGGASETPALDALVLLSSVSGRDKAGIFAHCEEELEPEKEASYEKMLRLRLDGEPVSYILNYKEFFGLGFYVDERVLVPRPDTEALVEAALDILRCAPPVFRIHDVCTGTGCIPLAIAAALEGKIPEKSALDEKERVSVHISASDISEEALEVFRLNCERILGRVLPHTRSTLLRGVQGGPFDMITANPPYLTQEETAAMKAGGWPEPALALDGGKDGLQIINRLIEEAPAFLREGGYLLVEGADSQGEAIRRALCSAGWQDVRTLQDLGGQRRVVTARRGP
ncbi:MAG: peptide chain release factor N(5)-glutamine methyltransferase [Spirochaetales bacterium]|jgi:release factor glutamine methyltransferase|nr:peptide chain release factor N(5)-glutamine methyltransferase [Spirochaetales bacterium]